MFSEWTTIRGSISVGLVLPIAMNLVIQEAAWLFGPITLEESKMKHN